MPSIEFQPSGTPVFATTEAMMRHPKFDTAVATMVDGLADLYGDDRRLVRSLFEYNRAVTLMIAVGIEALQRENADAEPMSVATMVAAGAQMGIGPPRRIRRLVEEMREDGLLVAETLADDRRRHRLRATERMLEIDREWLAIFHAPLLEMVPDEPRFRAGVARDPAYQQDYRYVSQETLAMANQVMIENPPVDFFIRNTSGARLLAVLLQAARDDPNGWTPTGFYSAAATRTATSRVHIRTVLHSARDAGLVEISDAVDGRIQVSAELRDGFTKWAAHALLAVDLVSAFSMESARQRRSQTKLHPASNPVPRPPSSIPRR